MAILATGHSQCYISQARYSIVSVKQYECYVKLDLVEKKGYETINT